MLFIFIYLYILFITVIIKKLLIFFIDWTRSLHEKNKILKRTRHIKALVTIKILKTFLFLLPY